MKRTVTALALSVASVVATSQNNPDATPTFHASTHLVQIRAIVRDKDGPVSGLTKDDFILLDRGKPQEIKVFSPEPALPHASTPPRLLQTLSPTHRNTERMFLRASTLSCWTT